MIRPTSRNISACVEGDDEELEEDDDIELIDRIVSKLKKMALSLAPVESSVSRHPWNLGHLW